MLIECGHCGAPIDVKPKARVAKCRYCGSSDERERLRTVAAETPQDYKPAKEWVPPPHAAAASEGTLRYSDKNVAFFVLLGALVVILGCAIPALLAALKPKPKPATLAHLSILGTPADVAKRLGGTVSPPWVTVPVSSDVYENMTLAYGKAGDPVPTEIWVNAKGGQKPDPATKANLSARLNGGFLAAPGGDGYWRWDDVSFQANAQRIGGSISKDGKEPAATRQRRMVAVWGLILGAAFDPSLEPSDGDMRELFGGGYPLASLTKLPVTTTVDQASRAALALFPGSIVNDSSQMKVTIALDHPLLKSITLDWFVRVGGTVEDVGFELRPAYASARADLARCLSAKLGSPHEKVDDPIHGIKSYTYTLGHTQFGVSSNVYLINETSVRQGFVTVATSYPIEEDAWEKTITALDGCRVGN